MSVYIYIYICVRTCVYKYIDVLFLATKHGLDVNFWDFRPDLPFFPRIFGNPRHMAKLNAKVDNSWDKRSSWKIRAKRKSCNTRKAENDEDTVELLPAVKSIGRIIHKSTTAAKTTQKSKTP